MRYARVLRRLSRVVGCGRSAGASGGAASQPPHHIAASFAIGLFVATLPTPGLDTITLVAIGWRYDWANRWALGLSLAILNPVVKGFVYVGSFALGSVLLGPGGGHASVELSLAAGPSVLSRLVFGNVIIAVAVAGTGYAIAHSWATNEAGERPKMRPAAVVAAAKQLANRPRAMLGFVSLPLGLE